MIGMSMRWGDDHLRVYADLFYQLWQPLNGLRAAGRGHADLPVQPLTHPLGWVLPRSGQLRVGRLAGFF